MIEPLVDLNTKEPSIPSHAARSGLAVVLAGLSVAAQVLPIQLRAQEKKFSGVYGFAEFGRQHLIGGSLVDGVDFLQEKGRSAVDAGVGLRYQSSFGVVAGVEIGVGRTDGDMTLFDAANQLDISYRNDRQSFLGLTAGYAFGARKNWLLFAYLSEATRKFSVTVVRPGESFVQNDEQGFLRYGLGVETELFDHFGARATVGTGRADFGNRPTNIDIPKRIEASLGFVVRP